MDIFRRLRRLTSRPAFSAAAAAAGGESIWSADRVHPAKPVTAASPGDLQRIARTHYRRWALASGSLWISVDGDRARHCLVEHLHRHPELLVTDVVWRERLAEVTVARATQVLLAADDDRTSPGSVASTWQLTDEVTDMLLGLTTVEGAQIPAGITTAFVTALELRNRYLRECTYENTPLGFTDPDREMDEFPQSDASATTEAELHAFLRAHPELAGVRDFADWYEAGSIGPRRDGL